MRIDRHHSSHPGSAAARRRRVDTPRQLSLHTMGALALGASLFAAACRDANVPASPVAPIPRAASSASATDRDWTHFAADVTVETTGPRAFGRAPTGAHQATYHLDRVRQPDGRWRTTVTPAGGATVGAGPDRASAVLGRIERDDVHGKAQLYTRGGQPMHFPSPAELQQRYGAGRRQMPSFVQPGAGAASAAVSNSRWTRAFSIDPSAAADVRGKLQQQFQLSGHAADGAERYARIKGDTTVEVTLDPVVGQVREVRASAGGRTVLHATHSFTALPNGLYAQTSTRVERLPRNGTEPVVTTITYSNLTLDRNGGQ